MLKQRLLTALLLGPLAIWATLALSSSWFAAILGMIFCIGAWEWSGLAGLKSAVMRHVYVALFVVLLIMLFDENTLRVLLVPLAGVAALWWCAALVFVLNYPRGAGFWSAYPSAVSLAGLLSLLPAWLALAGLHAHVGPAYVLLLLCLVWGADIGAYFAGRAFGRRKLAPEVSPGKTWAGVGGALGATVLIAMLGAMALQLPARDWGMLVMVSLLAVAVSILGDLTESMFKRIAGVKDSGQLLPGHGGVLDRIDSLLAAAPIFALGLLWPTLL